MQLPFIAGWLATLHRRPFFRLVLHFGAKTVGISTTADFDFGLNGALALLALPSAFATLLLLDKYASLLQWLRGVPRFNPYNACIPDEYFFIIYSMAVTALITLMRWEHLLPDARDFANLAPLPLPLPSIFGANLAALAGLAALFAFDINLVPCLLFPFLVTMQADTFTAWANVAFAHTLAVIGISAFTFLFLVVLQGLLMIVFPNRLYHRVALFVRTVLLILFSGMLMSVFLLPTNWLRMRSVTEVASRFWPPLWFLSLFETLVAPLRAHALVGSAFAWQGLGALMLIAPGVFVLSYRRRFLRIPELQELPARRRFAARTNLPDVDIILRPFLRPGLETACFQFMWRTLARSEMHLLLAGLWAGIGMLLTLERLQSAGLTLSAAVLLAPLTFTPLSLAGVRFTFDLPSAAHANWPFRLLASEGVGAVRAACRKLLWFLGVVPIVAVWLPIAIWIAGARGALIYLCFHLCLIALTPELLLGGFQKIPFACQFKTSRDRLLKMLLAIIVFLLAGAPLVGVIEVRVAARPVLLPVFVASAMAIAFCIARRESGERQSLQYVDDGDPGFVLLQLGSE